MSYSRSDFFDDIVRALAIDLTPYDDDDVSGPADACLETIGRMRRLAGVWKVAPILKSRRAYDVTVYATNRTVLVKGSFKARNRLHAILTALNTLRWGDGRRVDIGHIEIAKVKGANAQEAA